jgi:hypothetical protein
VQPYSFKVPHHSSGVLSSSSHFVGDCPDVSCQMPHMRIYPIPNLRLKAKTSQTPTPAAFDIKVDVKFLLLELLLAVATVDVACRYCTLAIDVEMGVHAHILEGSKAELSPIGLAFFTAVAGASEGLASRTTAHVFGTRLYLNSPQSC